MSRRKALTAQELYALYRGLSEEERVRFDCLLMNDQESNVWIFLSRHREAWMKELDEKNYAKAEAEIALASSDRLTGIAQDAVERIAASALNVVAAAQDYAASIPHPPRNPARNAERDDTIVRLRNEGHSFGRIPRLLKGINPQWVQKDGKPLSRDSVERAYHRRKKLVVQDIAAFR